MSRTSLRSPHAVFDIDGTLVDTAHVVRSAYKAVGIDMPDSAFGIPWRNWLPALVGDNADQVYRRKQIEYMRLLEREPVTRLPAAKLLDGLVSNGWIVAAVTMGAHLSADLALRRSGLDKLRLLGTHIQPDSRPGVLTSWASRGMYFDDLLETCATVRVGTRGRWRPVWVRPQDDIESLTRAMKLWPRN